MPTLAWIIAFTALGGVLSAIAASSFLLVPESRRTEWIPHLVSFATGALLAASLLGLLPDALMAAGLENAHRIGIVLLAGLLIFFVLEKLVLWRHCHQDSCEGHQVEGHRHGHGYEHDNRRQAASGWMILFGDGFHNLLDGVLIAAAFMTETHLGVVTAMAVIIHEIPQEIGDLAILLHSGMSRAKALVLNLLASLTSVIGGVVAYFALSMVERYLPYAITLAAASFIYIAVADLIPGLHRRVDPESGIKQFSLITLGVALIYYLHSRLH